MKAAELIALLQGVPAESEVEICVGEDGRGDWCQVGIQYTATRAFQYDDAGNQVKHKVIISELVTESAE